MGNSLCKEPNVSSSLHPGRVLENFGSLICPNGLGKSKPQINRTYLNRHVFETSPKSNTIDSWRSATLSVPDGAKVIDRPPVAPPRKKRATLERGTTANALKVKNGFKDVFGPESRRQSHDVQPKPPTQDTVDEGLQGRSQSCYEIDAKNDAFSDFSKIPTTTELEKPKVTLTAQNSTNKLLMVGNRKSDKFFGENLSDALSIDPVVTERRRSAKKGMEDLDKIDQFVEKHVLNKETNAIDTQDIPKIEVSKPQAKVTEEKLDKLQPSQKKKDFTMSKEEQENQENLIKYIDENVGKDTSLGKKAEFLMAMLEDYPEDRYLGMTPVEEPVIIPRKRKSRHICDDDNRMHDLLHKHELESASKKLITTEASIETPPRKPSRDFAKYIATIDGCSDSDDSNFGRHIRKQRPPSRKSLPSPPIPPKLPKSLSESQFRYTINDAPTSTPRKPGDVEDQKAHTPRMLKRIISMPTTANLEKVDSRSTTPQPVLLKSSSSSSFLIKDLQKAHISVGRFTPEDHYHHTADELVKPKSRLTTRKISVKSNDSIPSTPTSTQATSPPKFMIGSSEVVRTVPTPTNLVPPTVPKRRKSSNCELKRETIFEPVSHKRPLPKEIIGHDLGSFLESSQILHHHDVTNVIENVYNATDGEENIIKEFQLFLEDQINAELNDPNSKNPNTAKLLEVLNGHVDEEDTLENVKLDLVGSDDSNKASDIDDCFDPEFEKIETTEVNDKLGQTQLKSASSSERRESVDDVTDWFESGSDVGSVIEGSDKLGNMVSVKNLTPRLGRRESIEDVDSWFMNHNDLLPREEQIIGVRKQRRGSDGFIAYDTSRQYPFTEVKHRRDSLSADLFEDITKLHELGVSKDKPVPPPPAVKNLRLSERRGSDGLIFYDTSRKYPFGEPNVDLPKALEEEESKKKNTNNESEETIANSTKVNLEVDTEKVDRVEQRTESDHSTLLKFLSKENLVE